jgi:hypothetical protein
MDVLLHNFIWVFVSIKRVQKNYMLKMGIFISFNLLLQFHNDPLSAFATLVLLRPKVM